MSSRTGWCGRRVFRAIRGRARRRRGIHSGSHLRQRSVGSVTPPVKLVAPMLMHLESLTRSGSILNLIFRSLRDFSKTQDRLSLEDR